MRVSVIVPVKNRRDLLRRTLDALDRQTHRDLEVIVVDDGSTDGADELAATTTVAGRPVRLLRNAGRGAVEARRHGVAASDAPVLAFTDSDCEPVDDWLARALVHVEAGTDLVHGRTGPSRPLLPLERSLTEEDYGLFPTCNLVVTRAAYDEVDGFDVEAGRRLGFRRSERAAGLGFGEDTLFGWSVARHRRVAYEPEMVVHHHVFPPDLCESVGRAWQMGAFPALVREVPELRRTLVRRRIQWGRRSRLPVYLVALSTLTRRPTLMTLAVVWWARHRYRGTVGRAPLPLPRRLQLLPAEMLIDVVQAAALLSGSLRARTLLI